MENNIAQGEIAHFAQMQLGTMQDYLHQGTYMYLSQSEINNKHLHWESLFILVHSHCAIL